MKSLKSFLQAKANLSESDWSLFSSLLSRVEVGKKTMLLKKGSVEQHVSFVEVGTIRFFVPQDENDITFAFIFQDEFVCAYDSFLRQLPSTYAAETLSDTVLWRLSYQNLQKLYQTLPGSNVFGRILTEEIYLKKAARELSFLTKSAEERYSDLFQQRPGLIQNIPLKYIASYIGVTPQALSRIRSRIS